MSRSRRHTPVMGWCGHSSEKQDKQIWHRAFRRITRQTVKSSQEPPISANEVVNPYSMAKDGKMRFNPKRWPKEMRK